MGKGGRPAAATSGRPSTAGRMTTAAACGRLTAMHGMTLSSPPDPAATVLPGRAAFKDWALVCEAIGRGRQSVILRKGGLAEGRNGFEFKHPAFWLFPTQFHEQAAKVRPEELAALQRGPVLDPVPGDHAAGGLVTVRYGFRLEWTRRVEDWATVARLAPFHVYREEVARERFAYADRHHQAGALTVAFGRACRLGGAAAGDDDGGAWRFPDSPAFGGCRSWVELPEPPADRELVPALGDDEHRARAAALGEILGGDDVV